MRWFLFLARVAFICNLFFIIGLFLRITSSKLPQGLTAFVVIAGIPLSIFLNLIVNVWLAILMLNKQNPARLLWVIIFNLLCFMVQVFVYFFL